MTEQQGALVPVDAQFHELAPVDAERAIASYHEGERIKARLLTAPSDWDNIEGRLVPSAEGAQKLIPPFGISFELISKDEHGNPGVYREITDTLDYVVEEHEVKKRGKNGGTYTKTELVRTGEMRRVPTELYTVTVRATDRWGRFIERQASLTSAEEKHAQSVHKMRAIAQTRAEKKALLALVGGIDGRLKSEDENTRENRFAAARAQGNERPVQYGANRLMQRAIALGVCRDGASFAAWVSNEVPGCASCIAGKITADQSVAIHNHLETLEGRLL